MFLVWGSKWQYKVKENGLRVNKTCPECDNRCDFIEVIPTKYFTLFWIPLFSTETKKPLLECTHCHERVYIQHQDYMNAIKSLSESDQRKQKELQAQHEDHGNSNCTVFQCQHCRQNLRIPIKKELLKITCPTCKNIFHFQDGMKV
jgi:hypothetical protein